MEKSRLLRAEGVIDSAPLRAVWIPLGQLRQQLESLRGFSFIGTTASVQCRIGFMCDFMQQ